MLVRCDWRAGGVDGTARLLHVVNKRILATLVHSDPTAMGSRKEGDMEVRQECFHSRR